MHMVARTDPREQPVMPPCEPHYFIRFQRELNASEHIRTIANLLANTHFMYEGWGQVALPLNGPLLRSYGRIASTAVRMCSEPDLSMAQSQTVVWGSAAFDRLQVALASPDATESVRKQLIGRFLTTAIEVYRHALEHGAHGSPHAAYQALIDGIADGTEQ